MGMRRFIANLSALLVVTAGLVPVGAAPTNAAGPCAGVSREAFAIDGADGRLRAVVYCSGAITDAGVVDGADWRGFQRVAASFDGTVTEIFAVTGDGGLMRRTRPAPGQPFGPAVQVGAGYDWAGVRTLIATPKTLVAQFDASPSVMSMFEVTTAGIAETTPLFESFGAPHLSGINGRYAEINADGRHFRTWNNPDYGRGDVGVTAEESWFSGDLPGGVHGVTGTERFLTGLDERGRIVVLTQSQSWPYQCHYNWNPFTVRATSTVDGVVGLVVPAWVDPDIQLHPSAPSCPIGTTPWEWQ